MSFSNYDKAARMCANDSFQSRVRGILVNHAMSVKNEPYQTVSVPNNPSAVSPISAKRAALADQVLGNTPQQLDRFAYIVALSDDALNQYAAALDEDTIQKIADCAPLITDAVIESVIVNSWNTLAGVNTWDN